MDLLRHEGGRALPTVQTGKYVLSAFLFQERDLPLGVEDQGVDQDHAVAVLQLFQQLFDHVVRVQGDPLVDLLYGGIVERRLADRRVIIVHDFLQEFVLHEEIRVILEPDRVRKRELGQVRGRQGL